jgi:hypothetical protein
MLHGSQGSAKSSLQELIKTLADPSVIKTYTFPRDNNELIQQLSHNQVVYYDNVSIIKESISDQLCRAVSGSGSSKRQLYTDDDDIIYNFKRCVGFNGINLGATKADLLDRGLIIKLERIEEEKQCKPGDIWKKFEEIRPQLLGYIFDILVKVLQWKNNVNGPQLNLNKLPRMVEFAESGEIISRIMGNPGNKFIDAYYRNIALQSEEVLESSMVATVIIHLVDTCDEDWIGTPTQLLNSLESIAKEMMNINTNSRSWPKSPNSLSRRLNEIRVNLRQVGIEIEWSRDRTRRIITVRKIPYTPLTSYTDQNQAQNTILDVYDIRDSDEIKNISLTKNGSIHAQNQTCDDIDDVNDTIQTIKEIRDDRI